MVDAKGKRVAAFGKFAGVGGMGSKIFKYLSFLCIYLLFLCIYFFIYFYFFYQNGKSMTISNYWHIIAAVAVDLFILNYVPHIGTVYCVASVLHSIVLCELLCFNMTCCNSHFSNLESTLDNIQNTSIVF